MPPLLVLVYAVAPKEGTKKEEKQKEAKKDWKSSTRQRNQKTHTKKKEGVKTENQEKKPIKTNKKDKHRFPILIPFPLHYASSYQHIPKWSMPRRPSLPLVLSVCQVFLVVVCCVCVCSFRLIVRLPTSSARICMVSCNPFTSGVPHPGPPLEKTKEMKKSVEAV